MQQMALTSRSMCIACWLLLNWPQKSANIVLRPNSVTLSRSQTCNGFRPVADRFELSRHVQIHVARTCSQTGSQLAFAQLSTGLRRAHDTHTQVCDLDSVMEFGLLQSWVVFALRWRRWSSVWKSGHLTHFMPHLLLLAEAVEWRVCCSAKKIICGILSLRWLVFLWRLGLLPNLHWIYGSRQLTTANV